jgi:uncharacterized protein YgiM (DUF1202 family)
MKNYILSLALILSISALSFKSVAQSNTVSKNCGSCKKDVSANSKVGQTCPHCRVKWGYENTHTENNIPIFANEPTPYSDYSYSNSSSMYEPSTIIRLANLRAAPSTKSEVLMQLEKNQSVTITKISGDWAKVTFIGSYNGSFGTYHGWLHISNVVL